MTATGKTTPGSLSFDSLTQSLTFANASQETWWRKTGEMLARVLHSADYSREERQKYLRFHADVLVPLLGPYPQRFHSSTTRSGLPLELSVNYRQYATKPPVVRIGFEPIGDLSGTEEDPFNRVPATKLVSMLAKLESIRNFNTQLGGQAIEDFTVNEAEEASLQGTNIQGGYIKSQSAFGFDLVGDGEILVEGYTFPALKCKVTGKPMGQIMAEGVKKMRHLVDCSQAFSMVNAYLTETVYDERSFFSWDFVDPSKSRLKIYSSSNNVTWEKLAEVWTLGGRLDNPTRIKGLEYLRRLFDLINLSQQGERTVEVAFDNRKDSSKTTPLVWNYEMRPDNPTPLTKIYFPVHGENDMQVITSVAEFFRQIGMVALGGSYVAKVQSYYPEFDLRVTDRFTSWLSFAYTEKTGVYLSVYYHASTENPWATEELIARMTAQASCCREA
ncbi:DMATS type aromatic prenyltransferase [Aspergillus spinulosporus]